MAQLFKADKPPSSALCEKVLILGVSVETLTSNLHVEALVNEILYCPPEVVAEFPKDEDDNDSIKDIIFPGNSIDLRQGKQPPSYECHSVNLHGVRMRVHCVKTWEQTTPIVAYQSSPLVVSGLAKAQSMRVNDLKRRASSEVDSVVYVPTALCMVTQTKYLVSFRSLLEQLITYMQELAAEPALGPLVANTEFIRIVTFLLNDTYLPPKCTKLTLNFGYKSIEFPIDYINEPIHNEACIQTILDVMETDALLTLWQCLLVEKNVIVMSKYNNVICDVLEGLKMLIFPLQWVLTYVPLLSRSPLELLTESRTFLAGINTSTFPFAQIATKPFEGAVYNIDTGQLYLYPKHFDRICACELAQLRTSILSLKSYQNRYFERANIESDYMEMEEDLEPDAWKWHLLMCEDEKERVNYHILETRDAFLRPLLSNLRHYSMCFTAGDKRNMPSFDELSFTRRISRCGATDCKSVNFWKAVVHTRSFNQLLDEHSTWDESNSATFRTLLDTVATANCTDVLWHCLRSRSKYAIYNLTLEPKIPPKGFYIQVSKTLEGKPFQANENKFNTYLTRGREYLRDLQVSMKHHPYFTEKYRDLLTPPTVAREEERNIWYSSTGLIRHIALVFECMDYDEFKELNCNEELLRQLEEEPEQWQVMILKAYVQEVVGLPANVILRSYTSAYNLNGGWVPFHRFALVLQNLPSQELDLFESNQQDSSVLQAIVRNVQHINRAACEVNKTRSARSSPEPLFRPEIQSLRNKPSHDGIRNMLLRKIKKFGTVMGVLRESQGAIEIRTVPLNDRFTFTGEPREGHIVAMELILTLKRILAKYKSKIEGGKIGKLLKYLENDMEFKQLNDAISELQVVNLSLTSQQNMHETLCFYLNLHNFMVLYGLLVKKETPNSAIEWHKFLSSVCCIVGEERMTPILVEKMLLGVRFNSQAHELAVYTTSEKSMEHPITRYAVSPACPVQLANFGLYIPANFSTGLRVYTPKSVDKQLEEQARTCCIHVSIDMTTKEVTVPAIFHIKDFGQPDHVMYIVKKVLKGHETRFNIKQLLKAGNYKLKTLKSVEDWRFSLRKVLAERVGV